MHSPVLSGQGAFLRPLFTRAFFPHIAAPNNSSPYLKFYPTGAVLTITYV